MARGEGSRSTTGGWRGERELSREQREEEGYRPAPSLCCGTGPPTRVGHGSTSVTLRRSASSTSVDLPLFLPQSPHSIYILFDLYLYSEGTQASTLWRVSSWSPSRSRSFRCVSSSPSTLTSTASLESTFDRLPLCCLSFM